MRTIQTRQADFYDLISYRLYGSEFYMEQLIAANPDLRLVVRFEAGTELRAPEVRPMPLAGLAPWREVLRR